GRMFPRAGGTLQRPAGRELHQCGEVSVRGTLHGWGGAEYERVTAVLDQPEVRAMRRASVLLSALVLVAAVFVPGAAEARGPVRGDEPLPGYTIENPSLPPAIVGGKETRVLQGVHKHAAYIIEVPPRWNGSLM